MSLQHNAPVPAVHCSAYGAGLVQAGKGESSSSSQAVYFLPIVVNELFELDTLFYSSFTALCINVHIYFHPVVIGM